MGKWEVCLGIGKGEWEIFSDPSICHLEILGLQGQKRTPENTIFCQRKFQGKK